MPDKPVHSHYVLGVPVSAINLDIAYKQILSWVRQREKVYVCVAPVSTLVEANQNNAYLACLKEASMVTPDGMPVVWLLRFGKAKQAQRTYGPDLMRRVCQDGQSVGLKHFFYGANEQTLQALRLHLNKDYPRIQIVGMHAPEYTTGVKEIPDAVKRMIEEAKPDVLWVALGSPKQDFWMQAHRSILSVPVMLGVGAAFDFIAQTKPQAPVWIQRSGFEWLFRLCCEPKRLAKRYLVGNLLFFYYLIKHAFIKSST